MYILSLEIRFDDDYYMWLQEIFRRLRTECFNISRLWWLDAGFVSTMHNIFKLQASSSRTDAKAATLGQ